MCAAIVWHEKSEHSQLVEKKEGLNCLAVKMDLRTVFKLFIFTSIIRTSGKAISVINNDKTECEIYLPFHYQVICLLTQNITYYLVMF